jgi:hypothetical protein
MPHLSHVGLFGTLSRPMCIFSVLRMAMATLGAFIWKGRSQVGPLVMPVVRLGWAFVVLAAEVLGLGV